MLDLLYFLKNYIKVLFPQYDEIFACFMPCVALGGGVSLPCVMSADNIADCGTDKCRYCTNNEIMI